MSESVPMDITQGVSVLIKACNEEARIRSAIESALAAAREIAPLPLEVIVADCLSSDRTVQRAAELANKHPVRVVQLREGSQRSCGAGAELAYEWSSGRYILLMDADMVLLPGFLRTALRHLQEHPELAGVAGRIDDVTMNNGVDRIRINNGIVHRVGPRPWLEGGGLYRRQAIEQAGGYLADARLQAYEEAELGLRLQRSGWKLERLGRRAVLHRGHEMGTLALLARRWRSGRTRASAHLLKLALGHPGQSQALRLLAHPLLTLAWWLLLPVLLMLAVLLDGLGSGAPMAAAMAAGSWSAASAGAALWLALRKRDAVHVMTSVLDWHLTALGLLHGLLRPMPARPPWLRSRLLADGTPSPRHMMLLP